MVSYVYICLYVYINDHLSVSGSTSNTKQITVEFSYNMEISSLL